jgi:hypothetical protein
LRKARATNGDDTLSVISEAPSMFSGKISHAERNLSNVASAKQKEMELMRLDYNNSIDEIATLKKKLSACLARRDTLEV